MNEYVLDNPIWHSLCSHHVKFSLGDTLAKRYRSDVAPFVALDKPTLASKTALASLITTDEVVYLLGLHSLSLPGVKVENHGSIMQMIWQGAVIADADVKNIERLTEADAPDMLALTTLAFPGYFRARTHKLGAYFGIRVNGLLVAMAGERMSLPGYQEVSAVCTHPDFTGRGYAQHLVRMVVKEMLHRGIVPFLHVGQENKHAQRIYEKLGFITRRSLPLLRLTREA